MKRIVFKFFVLSVLVTGSMFIFETHQSAASFACWETAYNKWNQCDGAYSNTLNNYTFRDNYCDTNSMTNCSQIAQNSCTAQANTTCANDPDPNVCFNNVYNNCHLSTYQSCHITAQAECRQSINEAYRDRGATYASCMGFGGDLGNCIEQMADGCEAAQSRVYVCGALYSGPDDGDAYSSCVNSSGISRCQ